MNPIESPVMKNRSLVWCANLLISTLAFIPTTNRAAAPVNAAETERSLIAVLKSDAPPDEKAITCKKLAVYGSPEAVPVLAPLLLDPHLASWARIALEAIPGDAADAAFRDAVPKLQGRLLVGTINSIGVRRDRKAVGELTAKLKDNDPDVISAAAVALGRIGGADAAKSLRKSLASSPAAARGSVAEGCIRCAERFLENGQARPAIELYDLVRKADVPKESILEGVRGAILARKDDGIPLLVEQLHSNDRELFRIGLRAARELPGTKATATVAAEMQRATPEHQPLLLLALSDRPDDTVMPTILQAANTGPKNLRLVAVGILDRMGKLSTVPTLLQVAEGNDVELTQASLVALTRMPGTELDARLLGDLGHSTGKSRQVLLELAARRQIEGAVPLMVKDAENQDPGIRSAAVQALGSIGGTAQVNDLVKLFSSASNDKQRQDLEGAILAISSRLGNGCAQSLLPLAQNSDASVRKVALHALASAGGSEALTAVKQAVEDQDETVQDEAVRTLSTWPNTWPEDQAIAEPLLNLAKNSKKANYQVLAMRGYLQFLEGDKKMKGDEKLAKVDEALLLMNRFEEKRSAIAVVQSVPSAASLEMLVKFAGDPALTDDACSAIVELAGKRLPGVSSESRRSALQAAIDKSSNEETRKRARAALEKIR
jgi:HEAT repeat protein